MTSYVKEFLTTAVVKMALLKKVNFNLAKTGGKVLKLLSASIHNGNTPNAQLDEILKARGDEDMPVQIENPFQEEKPKCILCEYNIKPDYRNVRLLSQFVSRFTGRIYGRHITGLCRKKQQEVEYEILKAQHTGLMGYKVKNPKYYNDPILYDSIRPLRPHPF